jgi:hypothetical protein
MTTAIIIISAFGLGLIYMIFPSYLTMKKIGAATSGIKYFFTSRA